MKKILIIISTVIIVTYLFGQVRKNSEESIYVPLKFHGYPCTEDCSGHTAGFDWAEEHGITDPGDCGGKSESFIEGCRAYAEEYQDLNNDEDEY